MKTEKSIKSFHLRSCNHKLHDIFNRTCDINDSTCFTTVKINGSHTPSPTISSALRNISFQTHSAQPPAAFLLSVIFRAAIHILTKNVLKMKKASLRIFSSVRKGKGKKNLAIQKVSQLWNERWDIQRGFMSLTVQCSADCNTPSSWSQPVPPPWNQPSPALSLTLLNCYSLRLMPLIQIIKVSPIWLLKSNLNT